MVIRWDQAMVKPASGCAQPIKTYGGLSPLEMHVQQGMDHGAPLLSRCLIAQGLLSLSLELLARCPRSSTSKAVLRVTHRAIRVQRTPSLTRLAL